MGFGLVAQRFIQLLLKQEFLLDPKGNPSWIIAGIATAHHGLAVDPDGINPDQALQAARNNALPDLHSRNVRPSVPDTFSFLETAINALDLREYSTRLVVVENTPLGPRDGQPGVDHVRTALTLGAHVITANKGPAAFAHRELVDLAKRSKRKFLYEGSVLDGFPVFSFFRHLLPTARVKSFRGIVNTTTNHILSAMEGGRTMEEALSHIQAEGISETDSSNDVNGWDAAAKTAILVNSLMGGAITPYDVDCTGIQSLSVNQLVSARKEGQQVKLIASAQFQNDEIEAKVTPVTLARHDSLIDCNGTAKTIEFETDVLGRIQLGKSQSGVNHTAYALMTDLLEINRHTHQLRVSDTE